MQGRKRKTGGFDLEWGGQAIFHWVSGLFRRDPAMYHEK